MPCGYCSRTRCCALCFVDDDGRALFLRLMMSLFFFFRTIALLVLISPPHEVRTAAHTASEYDSYLHRRCWTAAASKGLFCLACVVLVLVAVRFASWTMMAVLCLSVDYFVFASWTMMAVLCLSVDYFVLYFFRSIALLILVLVSPPRQVYSFRSRSKCVRMLTQQAMTYTPFCPCLIGLPHTRSGSPLTSSIPLPVMLRAV